MNIGDLVADRFEVELLAGSGGVGQVFRARDRQTGERVAVKALRASSARDTHRFAREARVLARLHHPAIVRYITHGETGDGEPYLVMEWLEGEDLAARLARAPLLTGESIELVRRAAEALGSAHAHGVVHRDIKPSNLFLRGGRLDDLKVLDFGLAWLVDASRELTRTGLVVGTLGYMAPEQALGERSIDARADVFSLGCVLYRCLTGRPAFESDRIGAVLMKILHEDPPRAATLVSGLPLDLDALVARMLAKDPAARPADGSAVAEELGALLPLLTAPGVAPSGPPASLTRDERKLVCFIAVGTERNWLSTDGSGLMVLFEASPDQLGSIRAAAARFGGHLEPLADGSLLVTLSGGSSASDLATQAARCALAMRVILASAPIAIAMGRGEQGSGKTAAAAIELAAELLTSARMLHVSGSAPVPIRMDATTALLLTPTFEVGGDEHGLLLCGERPPTEKPRLLLGKPTPCVGRERELGALRAVFDECANDRVARMVMVTGPPGCGKSRVRRELARALQERVDPPEIWLAAAQATAPGAAFALLSGLVWAAARLAPEDSPVIRQHKLVARWERYLGRERALHVAAFLGEITATPFPEEGALGDLLRAARESPALLSEQVRRAWHDVLGAECEHGPVVLLLEDAQWADPGGVGLLMSTLRRLQDRPLLVVAFARPEVNELFPRLMRDSAVQEIRLGELTARASERLVRAVVADSMSAAEVSSIVERAGGNPFYLEELLRAAAAGQKDALPETVLAMVQARLEGLDPEARRVLRAASVFGARFQGAGVRALLGDQNPDDGTAHWLEALVETEMLEHPSGVWDDSGALAFRHAIVRQAVYATLSDDDRRLGHRLAGAWLAETGKGDPAAIARHLTLGGEPTRAAEWHLVAAEAALRSADEPTALTEAEQGVACGATGATLGALRAIQMGVANTTNPPASEQRATGPRLARAEAPAPRSTPRER